MKKVHFLFITMLVIVLTLSMAMGVYAADFPEKPVKLVIPFGAGGSHDAHARIIERFAQKYLGQPLIIELMPGGSGALASNHIAHKVKADGYTLLFGSNGCNTVLPLVQDLPYSREDFVPVARINYSSSIITAKPGIWEDAEDFIADVKANPGKYSYASSGMFNAGHIAYELFSDGAGIVLNHVPMQGGSEPQMALLSGQVEVAGAFADEIIDLAAENKVHPLVITSDERTVSFPEVPTCKELGYDVDWAMWRTVLAPKDTPEAVVHKLEQVFKQICEDPEFIELIVKMGEDVFFMGSDDFAEYWAEEEAKFEKIFGQVK